MMNSAGVHPRPDAIRGELAGVVPGERDDARRADGLRRAGSRLDIRQQLQNFLPDERLFVQERVRDPVERSAVLLEQALGSADLRAGTGDAALALEAEDGRYTIALQRVVYVKRYARESRVGFGAAAP